MKEPVISVSRELLSKNRAFCLYRFPGKKDLHLAVEPEYLPHKENKFFWMTPFIPQSEASEIGLSVVDRPFLTEAFLASLKRLPGKDEMEVVLPREMTYQEYLERLNLYLKEIKTGKLEKAILSRVIQVEKPYDFDPVTCFQQLEREYSNAFVYLLTHPKSGMWMGASPELLLQKRGGDFYTVALAGTRPRRMDGNYNWRAKELEEHEMVAGHIEAVFKNNHCTLKKKGNRFTVESGKVAHLKTEYIFRESSETSLKKLLSELQPTPAVGGLPVTESLNFIRENEGYDRQYYSGFLGETDFSKTADLYTNLRCMKIGKDKVAVYVGGGITAGSDPEEEWEETLLKSKTMAGQILPEKEHVAS